MFMNIKNYTLKASSFCVAMFFLLTGNGQTSTFNYSGTIVNYTVPAGVTSISIEARGAQGGSSTVATGGLGANMKGNFIVTGGQVLKILVGQQAPTNVSGSFIGGGGSGGSFVVNQATNIPMVIAGGGGGAAGQCCGVVHNGVAAVITTNATDGVNASGGVGAGGTVADVPAAGAAVAAGAWAGPGGDLRAIASSGRGDAGGLDARQGTGGQHRRSPVGSSAVSGGAALFELAMGDPVPVRVVAVVARGLAGGVVPAGQSSPTPAD